MKLYSKSVEQPGAVLLDLPAVIIPDAVQEYAARHGYEPKSEHHITVIGRESAESIAGRGLAQRVAALIDPEEPWQVRLRNEYIELNKLDEQGVDRFSIIQTTEITGDRVEDLYEKIGRLGLILAMPPMHITLYTKNYERGIGLYSYDDLDKYAIAGIPAYSPLR